ncbi:hypothetical protein [Microvirga sp. 17 mud 1-3]|uniref:hypothetical protein n=1 Tax=Microvirga sp. 17 mud 1-3 TaxID=2082949 RepID=UPI0013A52FA4|nr:hypothetical protein [Microvirga sp. 17 mud 1-3]
MAAELYRRGYSVALTMGNAKAIDLFAEKNGRAISVQVKAIRSKKSVGWPIMRDRIKSSIVYIFVCLNGLDDAPTYFVCTPEEAKERCKQYKTRGIIDHSRLNTADYKDRWDKLESLLSTQHPVDRPLS